MQYYLCFKINKIPDLTMVKYSVYDISGQEDLIEKHSVFLRQLHRLGVESKVFFHLLYYYDGQEDVSRGKRLQIIFYATAEDPRKLELIREFVTTSVLSAYYDFYCYEISSNLNYVLDDGYLSFTNISGNRRRYKVSNAIKPSHYDGIKQQIAEDQYLYCSVQPGTNEVTEINSQSFFLDSIGRIYCSYPFNYGAFLTKKDYHLYAQNKLYTDPQHSLIPIYSIMEWIPNKLGRLYNVLKLMEGYNETAALRIDIFPTDMAEDFTDGIAEVVNDLRQRMAQHDQGKDDNCDTILKSIEGITKKLMKYPQFYANIVAFSDHKDIAVMLVDSVGAEAVESGSYLVKSLNSQIPVGEGFGIYSHDHGVIIDAESYQKNGNYMSGYVSLYTLDEIRPMFSFPVLYPGESIECMKETDPEFDESGRSTLYLGMSDSGYSVNFPVKLFKKHAFIAGVPGAGKTNTLLYMVSELWTRYHIPFLVLEPAKQEYRALAKASKLYGMEALKEICIFSPGADTKFPLHINPFEFPIGLTLAEHIANLNAVFAGAFELPPPSPHFIDTCIEQVYINKGWNVNSRNDGSLPYPTMQELFDSLNVAVQNSHYQGETLGNLRSVMEVRVGSLLKREIGNVYNVESSSFKPEEWLDRPVIIELEQLGEGPANFMALLISTLIRETLKIRKTQAHAANKKTAKNPYGVNHVIFYEEAHNLVGPTQENIGDKVDPKVSATKFLVKMLAEVRALDEGIVIADQLPTVMAPEVLKNTGLKIGHRITANDDRELLGSTMSASPDQLAEQSIYLPGEALVFYEGLLKPFKMKVAKWQKTSDDYCALATDELKEFLASYFDGEELDASSDEERIEKYFDGIYDSPTDTELYALIHSYPVYRDLLRHSMEIIVQRVNSSFSTQYELIRETNETNIRPSYEEAAKLNHAIGIGKKHYFESASNGKKILAEIETVSNDFRNKKSTFYRLYSPIAKVLSDRINDCNNILFSNLAIVDNYGDGSAFMAACIIEAYLHLFERIDRCHLYGKDLRRLVLEKTAAARNAIAQYVAIDGTKSHGKLLGTTYHDALFELGHLIALYQIEDEFDECYERLAGAIDWKKKTFDAHAVIQTMVEYKNAYFRWMGVAAQYSDNANAVRKIVIQKYLELFQALNLLRDVRDFTHCIAEELLEVREDVRKYVCWNKDTSSGILAAEDNYEVLVRGCRNFVRVDIYEVFNKQAHAILASTLHSVKGDYNQLGKDELFVICQSYIKSYYDSFDICKVTGDTDLLAECIDLFYSLVTEVGVNLRGTARTILDNNIRKTYETISVNVRNRLYGSTVKSSWKKADAYWNGNDTT